MRIVTLIAIALVSQGALYGQKKEEPRYYTDSEVPKHLININMYGQPSTLFRRIGTDLNGNQPNVTDRFVSQLNGDVGLAVDVHLRPLYLGVGMGQTWVNYGHRNEDESLRQTHARYWAIPMRAGLVTQLSDELSLEVWPTVTYRKAISFENSLDNQPLSSGFSPSYWTAGVQVGASLALTDRLSFTLMGAMDYGFDDLEAGTSLRSYTELPLFIGVRTGFRIKL